MWIIAGILSALFLGIYDLFKKSSLQNNAVMPVLFMATVTSALIFAPLIVISLLHNPSQLNPYIYVSRLTPDQHFLVFIKSSIVGTSWVLSYYAIRHLPITVVSPIRASGPMWTIIGALLIFGERLTIIQWTGVLITFVSYYLFSLAGNKEGINFRTNRWVLFIFLATITGAASGLYDKYLISNIDRIAVQAWFSVYLLPVLFPVTAIEWFRNKQKNISFMWKYTIPLIGISLTIADYLYFYSLSVEGSLISIISVLRRSSVLITFTFGALIFKEINLTRKFLILFGILAGIIIIILDS